MNFLAAGFDELERKFQRGACRAKIWRGGRELTKAEIELGALGWQQADDFPPEIDAQLQAIHAWEREQADLTNQGADLQWNIVDLQKQLDEASANFRSRIIEWEIAEKPFKEAIDASASQIEEKKQGIQRFDGAIARLDAARDALAVKLEGLVAMEDQTLEIKEEIISIGDKRHAFENEKEDLQRARMRVFAELKAITDHNDSLARQIEEINQTTIRAREEFSAWEKQMLDHMAKLKSQKEHASKTVTKLDQKKSPAFLAIGRCLADSGIAPMNQPHSLDHVLALRETIASLQQQIEQSLEVSSQADQSAIRLFYTVVSALIAIAVIALFVLSKMSGHH